MSACACGGGEGERRVCVFGSIFHVQYRIDHYTRDVYIINLAPNNNTQIWREVLCTSQRAPYLFKNDHLRYWQ